MRTETRLHHTSQQSPLICVDTAHSANVLSERGYVTAMPKTIADIPASPAVHAADTTEHASPLYLMVTEHAFENAELEQALQHNADNGRLILVVPHCAIPAFVDASNVQAVSDWLSSPETDIDSLCARSLVMSPSGVGAISGFLRLYQLPLDDIGLAQRVKARFGHLLRWSHPEKTFYVFDGTKWSRDNRCHVWQYVTDTITALHEEALPGRTTREIQELEKALGKYRSQKHARSVVEVLKTLPGIPVVPTDFDNDPYLFSTGNAAIELGRHGVIRSLRPGDLTTKSGGVAYEQNATAPIWEKFLEEIMEGDSELVTFLKRYLGYCLSGETSQHVFPVFYGTGRNGKSVFMNVVQRVLGDYALPVPQEAVMSRRRNAGAATPEIAQLKGVRFAVVNETDDGKRLNEGQVKAITGGDKITARPLYSQQITFWPQFKVGVMTNYKPRITGSDNGIWRRMLLIPFNYTVPAEEVDPYLEQKLLAEGSGILNWMLEGYREFRYSGLGIPEAVREATKEYRFEEDIVQEFIEERCRTGRHLEVKKSTLFQAYQTYCKDVDEHSRSKRAFGDQLRQLGYEDTRYTGGRVWLGIGVDPRHNPEPRAHS